VRSFDLIDHPKHSLACCQCLPHRLLGVASSPVRTSGVPIPYFDSCDRRESLSNIRAVVKVRGNNGLEERVLPGLAGKLNPDRYGVPFLADNSFLPIRMELLKEVVPVRWYQRVTTSAVGILPQAKVGGHKTDNGAAAD
jgi:hypothetical protein